MQCSICQLPIHEPFVGHDYVDHVCCLRDETLMCKHDHRATK